MAKIEVLVPIIFKWEGGWADHKADKGGKTNMGITLSTWKSCGYDKDGDGDIDADDLQQITRNDVVEVLRKNYWNRWKADQIRDQSLANILVDWIWASGKWGIIIPQRLLKVTADGQVGPVTLATLNQVNPKTFFQILKEERIKFCQDLCRKDPSQKVFLQGWINRINDYKYLG